MNYFVSIPASLFWLSVLPCLSIIAWSIKTAPWQKLVAVGARQHLWLGGIVLLALLWSFLGVTINSLVRLHPMLMTSVVLLFGFRLGILQASAALLLATILQKYSWQALPFVWVCSILTPALITELLLKIVTRIHIQNLFLYTLGIGFAGGILTFLVIGFSLFGGLWLTNSADLKELWQNAYLFLMFAFPEGFCNGYIVSSFAIMAPHLVKTYDEDFFLKR